MPSINVNDELKKRLTSLKDEISQATSRRVTWNEVLQRLLDSHQKLTKVGFEVERLREVIEKALLKPTFATVQAGGGYSSFPPPSSPPIHPTGPLPPFKPPPPDPNARKVTGVRAELMQEMRQVFSKGVTLKPVKEAIAEDVAGGDLSPQLVLRIINANKNEGRELITQMIESILNLSKALQIPVKKKPKRKVKIDKKAEYKRMREDLEEKKKDKKWVEGMQEAMDVVHRIQSKVGPKRNDKEPD